MEKLIKSKTFKFKPIKNCIRIAYGNGDYLTGMDHVKINSNKIFAVIGPFESHTDKQDLQDTLEMLLRGYNLEEK